MNTPISYCPSTNQIRNMILGTTNTFSDEVVDIKDQVAETFETNIDYKLVTKNLDTTKTVGILLFGNDKEKPKEKKVIVHPYSIEKLQVGDYISFYNKLQNGAQALQVWLITSFDKTSAYEDNGTAKQCIPIKWQNITTGDIITRWGIFEKLSNVDGLDISKQIRVIDGLYKILFPLDSETKLLFEDKRFLIDIEGSPVPNAFRITDRNSMIQNFADNGACLNLILEKDVFKENEGDNKELMIANYKDIDSPISPVGNNYSIISCSNPANQISIGTSRTLTVVFYTDDVIDTTLSPIWNYTYPFGYTNQFTITSTGINKVSVKVKDNSDLIGKVLTVSVTDEDGNYSSQLEIKIIG